MGKNGLTLLEILVSVIILAMLVAGLTQVFVSSKKFTIHSRSRMAAAQMSKVFLDYLQMHVNATSWDDVTVNDLTVGLHYCGGPGSPQQKGCPADRKLDYTTYNATYTIAAEDAASFGLLRRVNLTVTWNETTLY